MPDTQDRLLLAQAIADNSREPQTKEAAKQQEAEAAKKILLELSMGRLSGSRVQKAEKETQTGLICNVFGACTIIGADGKPQQPIGPGVAKPTKPDATATKPGGGKPPEATTKPEVTTKTTTPPPVAPVIKKGG